MLPVYLDPISEFGIAKSGFTNVVSLNVGQMTT